MQSYFSRVLRYTNTIVRWSKIEVESFSLRIYTPEFANEFDSDISVVIEESCITINNYRIEQLCDNFESENASFC